MPPTGNRLPQASRPTMPSTNRLPSNGSSLGSRSEARVNIQDALRDLVNAPSGSSESSRRQAIEAGLLRLGASPQTLEAFQRGMARFSTQNEGNYQLDLSSDISTPPSLSPNLVQEEYDDEAEMNRQRRKRKRLASGETGHQHAPYGHKGQVVPGLLKLVVVDVNTHESNTSKDAHHQAKMLRRNWSVYATQTDHCDVILAHKGKVPFSLTKIVIKVPTTTTYRVPIAEGLVFVAMAADDFKRAAQYRLHSSEHLFRPPTDRTNPLQGADPTEGRGTYFRFHDRPPSRRADNVVNFGTTPRSIGAVPPDMPTVGWQQLGAHWVRPAARAQQRASPEPSSPPRLLSPPVPDSPYQVRSADDSSSDSEAEKSGDESEASTTSDRTTPERRTRARSDTPRPTFSPTPPLADSDDDEDFPSTTSRPFLRNAGSNSSNHASGRTLRSSMDHRTTDPDAYVTSNSRRRRLRLRLSKDGESNGSSEQKSDGGKEGQASDVLHPHARFTFEKGKTRVSIRFDPPISGKFILLKLWSKSKEQTIDIQNISAYGYVGQRYFASVQAQ